MYKFTDTTSEVKNVEINMRQEANSLINEFGINVLYIRNCKYVRCSCFDDLNKTRNTNCKICMGSGYFASIQKTQAIESSNSAYSDSNSIAQMPIGVTDQKNEIYYIRHNLNPKERDYILKVKWDINGNLIDIVKVLEIVNVYEMRGDNGRIELTGCVVNDRTDMVRSFTQMLKQLPPKAKNYLAKGGKSIWPNILLKKRNKN